MEQKFIDKIEDLRHHTYSRISKLQSETCPMVKKVYMNWQFEYWYEGYKYNLWEEDAHLYAISEVPYCYDCAIRNTTFIGRLDELIAEDKIWPFILFIDGVAIPWSHITVIHDYDYSYLKIDQITPNYSFYTEMVVFPLPSKSVRYGEDRDILVDPNRKGFYFGADGKRLEKTDFVDISMRLEILEDDVYYKEVNIHDITNHTLIFDGLEDGYVPTLNNILTFTSDGSFNHDGPEVKIRDIYNGNYGMFDVLENTVDVKWAILMYQRKGNSKESSFLYSKGSDLNKESIMQLFIDNPKESSQIIWDNIITPLIKTFDFDHQEDLDYDTNVANATKYITRYDFALWKDVFTENKSIKSITYTGEEFKALANDKGYVSYSRAHDTEIIQDVLMLFVNHKLYRYFSDAQYDTNTINVPIFGILNEDHVEVVLFTKCNNYILDIEVPDADTPVYIHPEYNLEDCYIMSEECSDATYPIEPSLEGRLQYIVNFTYTVDESSNYNITFENPDYYNKPLKIVPKKQFRYYRYLQAEGSHSVLLPTQFNYCHNPDQYMIFINGKKIDRTEYTITIMNKDRPFDKLVLYISTILDAEDYVDILYIPEALVEKYKQDVIPLSGLLILEDTPDFVNYPTTYPLSKSTSMVFINGLKVNPLDIKDVSLNAMLLGVDKYVRDEEGRVIYDGEGHKVENPHHVDSVNNVTIMEYVEGNKEVAGYLKGLYEQIPEGEPYDPERINFNHTASDDWKDLISIILNRFSEEGADYAGLQKLFGTIFKLDDPAADFKDNFADLRSVLYDTIIDFYLDRPEVTTGDTFVYEFEREHFDPDVVPDSTDVVKEINLYKDKDKLVDYELADQVASEEDVTEGQEFYGAD